MASQLHFEFRSHGGPRRGAGRKPAGARPGVSHRGREAFASRHPVHVTQKLVEGLPSLRACAERRVIWDALGSACFQDGFRIVHFSVQRDHLHLIVEADGARPLGRGMQTTKVRIARGLNRLWARSGRVFADRYHTHVLRTPREVRNTLCYVLQNHRKHGEPITAPIDTFSSAPWFDGFAATLWCGPIVSLFPPVAEAQTWLLSTGWRRHGPIWLDEVPGPPPAKRRRSAPAHPSA